jgi:hypothetical protein
MRSTLDVAERLVASAIALVMAGIWAGWILMGLR